MSTVQIDKRVRGQVVEKRLDVMYSGHRSKVSIVQYSLRRNATSTGGFATIWCSCVVAGALVNRFAGLPVQDFCINGQFPDYGGSICLPVGSNFTSGAAIVREAPVFGNCTGVAASAECAAARDVIFGGLNCPFCSEVAELVAPAQEQCAAIRSEQQCASATVALAPAAVSDDEASGAGVLRE